VRGGSMHIGYAKGAGRSKNRILSSLRITI
jgi:hypothetical protein